jgi:hypothetical protein
MKMNYSENSKKIKISTIYLASVIFDVINITIDSWRKEAIYLLCNYIDIHVVRSRYDLREIVCSKNFIIKPKYQINVKTILDQELMLFILLALGKILPSKFSLRNIEVIFKDLNIKVCFSGSGLGNSYEHIRKTIDYLSSIEHEWCFENEWNGYIDWLKETGTNNKTLKYLCDEGIRNKKPNNYYYNELSGFKRNLDEVFYSLHYYNLKVAELEDNYKTLQANHDDCELNVNEHFVQVVTAFDEFGNVGLGRNDGEMNLVCSRLKDEGGHTFPNSIYWPQSMNAIYRSLNQARKNKKMTLKQYILWRKFNLLHTKLISKQAKRYSELIEGNTQKLSILEH